MSQTASIEPSGESRGPGPKVALAIRRLAVASLIAAFGLMAATALASQEIPADPGPASASAEALPAWARAALESVRQAPPLLFFAALVVATFLPVPVALFYLTAGVAYGIAPALVWIAGSLVVSNVLIHTASRTFLRPTLEALVARRGHRIPRFDSGLDEALFITLIRLTPGIPYFLQNLILAVAQLDLLRFVVLSVGIQMIYVTGFVVLGRSALDGRLGWAIGGLAVLVAVGAGARMFAKRRGT